MDIQTPFTRDRLLFCIGGFAAGLLTGAATHTLPEWLCGPFRLDKAAEWSAAGVSAIAAAVTFWAVRVAIRSSNRAIAVERELRAADVERAETARRRNAGILAGSFIPDLRHVIAVCTERTRMLQDARLNELGRNIAGVERISTPNLDSSGSRSDVFDLDDGIVFLRLATAVHRIRGRCEVNGRLHTKWDSDLIEKQRLALIANLEMLRGGALRALARASNLCAKDEDPERSIRTGERSYQDRIEAAVGGYLPGGATTRKTRRGNGKAHGPTPG